MRTTSELNFETKTWHTLTVRASDGGEPGLASESCFPLVSQLGTSFSLTPGDLEINITVLNFNDHTPTFINPLTFTTISEGAAIGRYLTDFSVADSDSGDFGVQGVNFAIIAGTAHPMWLKDILTFFSLLFVR